jgi:hypothetical protein
MKRVLVLFTVAALLLFTGGLSLASNSAPQTVTFQVQAINEISVSGNPAALIVSAATAGSEPDSVSNSATTYAITTNCGADAKKITAAINADMPSGVTLNLTLAEPTNGTSAGAKSLSTLAEDVVTAIDAVAESGLTITYELSATVAAGVLSSDTRTVTLTLTDAS